MDVPMSSPSFPTTQWSLIISSASDSGPQAHEALSELCRVYWLPVYSSIRHHTASAEEAQDLTQDFFLQLLNRTILKSADPSAGRFRSYLAVCLKHFLADKADRKSAQKRGGGIAFLPLDAADAELHYASLKDYETPERIFDRQWALIAVTRACEQLEEALTREGRAETYRHLKAFLPGGAEPSPAAAVAANLGISEGAVKVAIHRLRRRYGDILRANVCHTLTDPNEVDDEIRFLLDCLSA
jgi:RNA polymerase sigma-70 factor (ECF subfamily)